MFSTAGLPNLRKKTARAAKDSAAISRWATIAGNRAYVHQNGFNMNSHFNKKTQQYYWHIVPRWINSGNTPTRQLETTVGYELRDSPLPDDFPFPISETKIPAMIAPKGIIGSTGFDIQGTDVAAVSAGKKHFYIWGIARYRDVFPDTELHVTKFCCFMANITGDPTKGFDAQNNVVGIEFLVHPKNNCADEDCANS